jgi:two-component system NtrC family response regulator
MLNYNSIQILLVDDAVTIRRLVEKEIGDARRIVSTAGSAAQAFDLIRRRVFDVIVLDIRLPDADGMELLDQFREAVPDVAVIFITGHGNIDGAVEAMKRGAYDYIAKRYPPDLTGAQPGDR